MSVERLARPEEGEQGRSPRQAHSETDSGVTKVQSESCCIGLSVCHRNNEPVPVHTAADHDHGRRNTDP
jgi:hypothetical protein